MGVSVARKNLFAEKTRLFVSVGGVAFSILLVIFLLGVYNAFNKLTTVYLNNVGADIIVAQEGVKDMFHTFSVLPKSKIHQVERVSGGRTYGLVSRATNVFVREEDGSKIVDFPGRRKRETKEGEKALLNIVGFDTKTGMGGPWVMLEGSPTPRKREVVVDQVFARQNDLSLGDQVEMFEEIFTIVGITDRNNMMVYSRAFLDLKEAQRILGEKDMVNFILVKLDNPQGAETIAQKLKNKVSGITVYKMSDFAKENAKMLNEGFLPIILVITIIGFLTGAVVVGLTVYTATMEKIREFGVLKAIGASNRKLFLIVFEQALWSSLLGFIIGIILTFVVAKLVVAFVPIMVIEFSLAIYALAFVAAVLMSIVASYIPIKRISGLDPAMVFRQ